jgi:hypothetical protein
MIGPQPTADCRQPTRRVIFLGASNLVRSLSTVVETARQIWREPVEIMAAIGHGRSYGHETTVLGRKISGIFPSALWKDLQNRPPLPTHALLTDIGNDLGYGEPPDRILSWVERCLDELERARATTVVTQLPLESLARLGERRYKLFRSVLFPSCRLELAEVVALASELNKRLVALGESRKLSVIPASGAWYGFDPIHLKRSVWHERRSFSRADRSRAGRTCAVWRRRSEVFLVSLAARGNRAASCAMERRSHSTEARRRALARGCASAKMEFATIAHNSGRKIFFHEGIFLAKTCCTNTANLYNYCQVEQRISSSSTR